MQLYRGQNDRVDGFKVTQGNDESLSEHGPGVYFFNHKHRSRALVYSLDNAQALFDDDAEEQLEKGYFYSCAIEQDESRTLDKLPVSDVDVEHWLDAVMDGTSYDSNFLNGFMGDSDAEKYEVAISYFKDDSDSIYELINNIHKELKPECANEYCAVISGLLDDVGSHVAVIEGNGEIIVYSPEKVSISNVMEVGQKHLKETMEERLGLARSIAEM